MKIGLFAVGTPRMAGGGLLKSVALNAERLGISTLWVPEHVVLLDKYASHYPYSDNGQLPAPTNAPIFDPFISLATMAAVTSKIRLATGDRIVERGARCDIYISDFTKSLGAQQFLGNILRGKADRWASHQPDRGGFEMVRRG